MSKLAKKPILIPEGVKVEMNSGLMKFSGKEGNLNLPVLPYAKIAVGDNEIMVTISASHKQARANCGTMAALIKNSMIGVSRGFSKSLEVEGIGFKAAIEAGVLTLALGYTHPIKFSAPSGIKIGVEKNVIKISGIDKNLVGQIAAEIRKLRKPEPYKGKGIHYVGEIIRRKAGKKVAGTGAAA